MSSLIGREAVRSLFKPAISAVTIWRYEKSGLLPKSVRVGGRCYYEASALRDSLAALGVSPESIDQELAS